MPDYPTTAEVRAGYISALNEAYFTEKARADRLERLVMQLGDRLLICAEILGRLAERKAPNGTRP